MTSKIRTWSSTAASNSQTPPNGAPEGGTNVNQLTDILRQIMAEVRAWWETPSWIDYGHTPTYSSGTVFTVTGNQTAIYEVGRRVRAINSTLVTIYGTITASAYSTTTSVTVTWDSGALDSTLTEVAVGIMSVATKAASFSALSGIADPTQVPVSVLAPSGLVTPYAGLTAPTGYLLCLGQAISRTTYAALFTAITTTTTATVTNANMTLSSVAIDFTSLNILGAKIEGTGIPTGTTVTGVTTTTITLSAAPTASGTTVAIRVLPHGNGDGSTTFNIPNAKGRVIAGIDAMGGTAASLLTAANSLIPAQSMGAVGGDERMMNHGHSIIDPGHGHNNTANNNVLLSGGGGVQVATGAGAATSTNTVQSNTTGISIANTGSGNAQNVQPTLVLNYIIKT